MKRLFTPYLILLVSLVVILCCRQQKEEAAPVPLCRIVKAVLKSSSVNARPIRDEETISVGGKNVKVSFYKESFYNYDPQGRLIREKDRVITGDSMVVEYDYSPGLVLKQTTSYSRQLGTHVFIDSIVLNTQGLAESKFYQQKVKYDTEGYLTEQMLSGSIQFVGQVVNGNLVKEYKYLDGLYVYKYEYDLTRSGPSPIYTFWGFESRNLLKKESIERGDSFIGQAIFETNYQYRFDSDGRVYRKIVHGEDVGFGWYADEGTAVIDYEYDCSSTRLSR
ncbi:hypothetical protein [Larkinella sp. C7]|uniref:hypothetical protein n=1 Tax=Larkinella sp. C7 TaxID=2576607 RepID=UPI001111593A|nr:hypothetical protein [Larkinella sp. C7]